MLGSTTRSGGRDDGGGLCPAGLLVGFVGEQARAGSSKKGLGAALGLFLGKHASVSILEGDRRYDEERLELGLDEARHTVELNLSRLKDGNKKWRFEGLVWILSVVHEVSSEDLEMFRISSGKLDRD